MSRQAYLVNRSRWETLSKLFELKVDSKAWGLFVERVDLGLSLTDCTSAVICADLRLDIWTYDPDFTALGITTLSDIDP